MNVRDDRVAAYSPEARSWDYTEWTGLRKCRCLECRWLEWMKRSGPWTSLITLTFRKRGGTLPGIQRSRKAIDWFMAGVRSSGLCAFGVEERGGLTGRLHWHVIARPDTVYKQERLQMQMSEWRRKEGFVDEQGVDNPEAYVLKYLLKGTIDRHGCIDPTAVEFRGVNL